MPKVKISEYSATANSNTDVASINIDEGCAPSGINNAIRAIMGHLKDFQQGTNGDPFNGPVNGTLGATTASTANVTTLTTSSTVTHNGGTANGVAYLNGSKVLTTGSALVFDGTNLGIGTTSPTAKLQVFKGASGSGAIADSALALQYDATTTYGRHFMDGNGFYQIYAPSGGVSGGNLSLWATNSVQFRTAGIAGDAAKMTLDSSGNLGIGASPAQTLHVKTSTAATPITLGVLSNATSIPALSFNGAYASTTMAGTYSLSGNLYTMVPSGSYQYWGVADVIKLTLDASGNLLVGKTSASAFTTVGTEINATGFVAITRSGSLSLLLNRETNNGEIAQFRRSNTTVGSIDVTTTATSYVTSSDYRLKNTIAPMTGALAKVAALKPVTYKWNVDGSDGEGFIAHELAEVVPQCVTGDKDAVDADGNPKYQGIDTSFLVATLTAAIQEQQVLITQLTARITALEGA